MERLKNMWNEHPNLVSWVVLSVGMLIILFWSARHVAFTPSQWVALVVATILLAGLSVWIIGWEDEEGEETKHNGRQA